MNLGKPGTISLSTYDVLSGKPVLFQRLVGMSPTRDSAETCLFLIFDEPILLSTRCFFYQGLHVLLWQTTYTVFSNISWSLSKNPNKYHAIGKGGHVITYTLYSMACVRDLAYSPLLSV